MVCSLFLGSLFVGFGLRVDSVDKLLIQSCHAKVLLFIAQIVCQRIYDPPVL